MRTKKKKTGEEGKAKKKDIKIMLLIANPVKTSFSYACGTMYEKSAKQVGAKVRRFNIEEMDFDPALHQGYEVIQELEPDLIKFQKAVAWADHLVFVYPNWWTTMPAKMKGLFDRSFLPGFAFKFTDHKFKPLLKGKSARVINISGSLHPFLLWCFMGAYTNELSHGVLKACGIKPICVTSFGPTRKGSEKKRERFLKTVKKMAEQDMKKQNNRHR